MIVLIPIIFILMLTFLYVAIGAACLDLMPKEIKCIARITLSFIPVFNFFYMMMLGLKY